MSSWVDAAPVSQGGRFAGGSDVRLGKSFFLTPESFLPRQNDWTTAILRPTFEQHRGRSGRASLSVLRLLQTPSVGVPMCLSEVATTAPNGEPRPPRAARQAADKSGDRFRGDGQD
jgi:hypothetical protein